MTMTWRKSSYSVDKGNCVELADLGSSVGMRDSKHPDDGKLTLNRPVLAQIVEAVKAGELDQLA